MEKEKRSVQIEVCTGSYEDCLEAQKGGARRVELNSALALGGLSPSPAVLKAVKADTDLEVIAMVRPRAGGFHYSPAEKKSMELEAQMLLEAGADGLAFGFLEEDGQIDEKAVRKMVELIHRAKKTAVFHRAIDVTPDYEKAVETLLALGVDRILTSGQAAAAMEGSQAIASIRKKYGDRIEILPGAGIRASNAKAILRKTGASQLHSSCKGYGYDPTTSRNAVSYSYLPFPHEMDYEKVDAKVVRALVQAAESPETPVEKGCKPYFSNSN